MPAPWARLNSPALSSSSALITSSCRSAVEPHEGFAIGLAAVHIELSEPATVEILKVGIGPGERQIDVIEHSRITRTRLARCAGHQPFGERRNRLGVGVVEERAMPVAI